MKRISEHMRSEPRSGAANERASQWEKVACGAFSDISSASAGKKRGFCRLRNATIGASQVR
jgi:hypothetical protein